MITNAQKRRIRERGISVHHDRWLASLHSGEPFLEEGLLSYYDGRLVTVIGVPLRGEPPPTRQVVRELVRRWTVDRQAEGVEFLGLEPVDLGFLARSGFHRVGLRRRRRRGAELALAADRRRWNSGLRRTFARARRLDFSPRVRRGGTPRAEQLRLAEAFYRSRELSGYLAEMAFTLNAALASPGVWMLEARRRDELAGFVMLDRPFARTLVAVSLFHDPRVRGVSDFLFAQMLIHARRVGADLVNVGPSPTRGHYAFKRKWGGFEVVPPYYLVEWARGSLARCAYTGFGPRLIGLS